MFDVYLQHRAEGCALRAAAELTAKLYGHTDPEDMRSLQRTLERLEERDRPPDPGVPPVNVPSSIAGVYLRERRAGRSHAEAVALAGHAFGHRGQGLDSQLVCARQEFEAETQATRPRAEPQSTGGVTV